jgi:hypothetical protein
VGSYDYIIPASDRKTDFAFGMTGAGGISDYPKLSQDFELLSLFGIM